MKPLPPLPSLLCALGIGLALVASAQDRPHDPPAGGPPPHDARFDKVVRECWIDAGEDPDEPGDMDDLDDPIGPDLMDLCMADKGFDHPPPPPPPPPRP